MGRADAAIMVHFVNDHEGPAPRVGIQTQLSMAISPLSEDVVPFVQLAVAKFADCGVACYTARDTISLPPHGPCTQFVDTIQIGAKIVWYATASWTQINYFGAIY